MFVPTHELSWYMHGEAASYSTNSDIIGEVGCPDSVEHLLRLCDSRPAVGGWLYPSACSCRVA